MTSKDYIVITSKESIIIILFSGCDKVKGFNTRINEVINKELNRYNSMAIICASDDYSKNDTLIDGTSDMMGIRSMFSSIKEFYLIDRRTSSDDMISIIKKVDIIFLFGGNPLIQLDIIKRIDYKEYMDEVFEVSKYIRIVGLPNESFIRIKDNDIDFVGKHHFIENGIME